MNSGITYTLNGDAANITITGTPSIFQLTMLAAWIKDNFGTLMEKKGVIVDLSRATYVGSQIIGIVVGIGKNRYDRGMPIPIITGGSDTARHLFDVTGTAPFVKFLGD